MNLKDLQKQELEVLFCEAKKNLSLSLSERENYCWVEPIELAHVTSRADISLLYTKEMDDMRLAYLERKYIPMWEKEFYKILNYPIKVQIQVENLVQVKKVMRFEFGSPFVIRDDAMTFQQLPRERIPMLHDKLRALSEVADCDEKFYVHIRKDNRYYLLRLLDVYAYSLMCDDVKVNMTDGSSFSKACIKELQEIGTLNRVRNYYMKNVHVLILNDLDESEHLQSVQSLLAEILDDAIKRGKQIIITSVYSFPELFLMPELEYVVKKLPVIYE